MSTPIDVAFGLLLVSASILVVVSIDRTPPEKPMADGTTVLGETMTVRYRTSDGPARITATTGTVLLDAARISANTSPMGTRFVAAVRRTTERRLSRRGMRIQIVATCRNRTESGSVLLIGPSPPSRGAIRSTVVGPTATDGLERAPPVDACAPIVVVREWTS
ncbi:MAG: hypothetical protein ABEJ58_08090 [Halodesulfurarchaeum sp.]